MTNLNIHYSSSSMEWGTPQYLFDKLDKEFKFDIDVCATKELAKCKKYFSPEEDGLIQKWEGKCWMNPPYGKDISKWIKKAYESSNNGTIVVSLVPARVDTKWWWDYCRFAQIRFLKGRLKFDGATANAPFPSAIVIFGFKPNVFWYDLKR